MSNDSSAGQRAGYARPPRNTRFKPGQSGNPNGRPRRKTNVVEIFERSLHQYVTVRIDGRPKRLTLAEALIHQILADAARGDHHARTMFLKLEAARAVVAAEAEAQAGSEEPDAPLSGTDRAILAQLRNDIREQVEREGSAKPACAAQPIPPDKPHLPPVRSRTRPNQE